MRLHDVPGGVPKFLDTIRDPHIRFHYGQNGEDIILGKLFNGKFGGYYVDVGAHHPSLFSNTKILHENFNWKGMNIDASEMAMKLFNKARPEDVNIRALVGLGDTEAVFTTFKGRVRSTADQKRTTQLKERSVEVLKEEKMMPQRLADILDRNLSGNQSIDLLNIDVENLDFDVLQSNDWERYRPYAVCIEDYQFRDSLDTRVSKFLLSRGYRFHSHLNNTSIYVAN